MPVGRNHCCQYYTIDSPHFYESSGEHECSSQNPQVIGSWTDATQLTSSSLHCLPSDIPMAPLHLSLNKSNIPYLYSPFLISISGPPQDKENTADYQKLPVCDSKKQLVSQYWSREPDSLSLSLSLALSRSLSVSAGVEKCANFSLSLSLLFCACMIVQLSWFPLLQPMYKSVGPYVSCLT